MSMRASGWHLLGEPKEIAGCRTTSEILAEAERQGYRAVRIALDGGRETLRYIAGEWVCTSTR